MTQPADSNVMDKARQYYLRSTCRSCGSGSLEEILPLGNLPLANDFHETADEPEETYPLTLLRCEACGLMQIADVVSPARLYRVYPYATSASAPLAQHFAEQARRLAARYVRSSDDLVCEIGSNDGCFLHPLKDSVRVVGVDPASTIAARAHARGVPTINAFFTRELARTIVAEHGRARLIYAANVLAHVDQVDDFMEGITGLLAPDGAFVLEVHWFADMLESTGFDQIYHEHLSYFTLSPLKALLERHGLSVTAVNVLATHGRSLQVHARPGASASSQADDDCARVLRHEAEIGVDSTAALRDFRLRVNRLKDGLLTDLERIRRAGGRIAGYGAPAKGNTLLNYCGIDRRHLDYLVDSTPLKQGRFAPGSRLPVHPPEHLTRQPVSHALLLSWNYRESILERERKLIEDGMQFIVPLPFNAGVPSGSLLSTSEKPR